MKHIDFIKRAVQDAEGFHFLCGKAPFEDYMSTVVCESHQYIIREKTFKNIIYPLLLQRAIEEINQSDNTCYFVQINPYSVCIHNVDTSKDVEIFDYNGSDGNIKALSEDIDKAKESALKYIYDQEKSNVS